MHVLRTSMAGWKHTPGLVPERRGEMIVANETRRNLIADAVRATLVEIDADSADNNVKRVVGEAMTRNLGLFGFNDRFVFREMSGGILGHLPDVLTFIRDNGWVLDDRAAFSMHQLICHSRQRWSEVHRTSVVVADKLELNVSDSYRVLPKRGLDIVYHPVEMVTRTGERSLLMVPGGNLAESIGKVHSGDLSGSFALDRLPSVFTSGCVARWVDVATPSLVGFDRVCADEGLDMVRCLDLPAGVFDRYDGYSPLIWGSPPKTAEDGTVSWSFVLPVPDIRPAMLPAPGFTPEDEAVAVIVMASAEECDRNGDGDRGIATCVECDEFRSSSLGKASYCRLVDEWNPFVGMEGCPLVPRDESKPKNAGECGWTVLEHRMTASAAACMVRKLGSGFTVEQYASEVERLLALGNVGPINGYGNPEVGDWRLSADIWDSPGTETVVELSSQAREIVMEDYSRNAGRLVKTTEIHRELPGGRLVREIAPHGQHFLVLVLDGYHMSPETTFGYPGDGNSFEPRWPVQPVTDPGKGFKGAIAPKGDIRPGTNLFLKRTRVRWLEDD